MDVVGAAAMVGGAGAAELQPTNNGNAMIRAQSGLYMKPPKIRYPYVKAHVTTTTAYLTAKLGASSRGLRVAGWMGPTVAGLGLAAAATGALGSPYGVLGLGIAASPLAPVLTLTPFLIHELNPAVQLGDFGLLTADAFLIDGAPSGCP